MENSPPGLFPENQNSNFGFIIRKIFTDLVQDLIGQEDELYNERFVNSSTDYLDVWEQQMGVPIAPTTLTLAQRRLVVLNRIQVGPFTHARRAAIIESYITATFGNPIMFSPAGISLPSAGVPFYTESGSLSSLYAVVENIAGFSYTVRLKNTLTVDMVGLTRELTRITPAGISFTIIYVATP